MESIDTKVWPMVKEWVIELSRTWLMDALSFKDFLILGAFVWLALLNFYLLRTVKHYKSLTKGVNNLTLGQILDRVIKKVDLDEKRIDQLSKEVSVLENINRLNFQKYALVRYNPFEDTGGDQSFIVAILDGENNGIVISSLHSRNGTRVYAKGVSNGKATAHQFSKEEKEVVEKACLPTATTARRA